MKVIDFHTHAFPEKIVDRAVASLEEASGEKALLDGRVSSLLDSMDQAGIEKAVIANIATRPEQFDPIISWSNEIRSDRIIPFFSIHPDDDHALKHIQQAKAEGFKGIKLHPYYQNFILDEKRMYPIYEKIAEENLILLSHTGFDIAFDRDRICDPEKINKVIKQFPNLIFVASHGGAWEDWDKVEKYLIGKPVYIELSFSVQSIEKNRLEKMLEKHDKNYLLFGTDSPWVSQQETLLGIDALNINDDLKEAILYANAKRLLQ